MLSLNQEDIIYHCDEHFAVQENPSLRVITLVITPSIPILRERERENSNAHESQKPKRNDGRK